MTTLEPPPDTIPAKTPRRAALASFMGSAVEYYDFFLFGSAAALIFPHIFFPKDDTAALVMSFMTFGFAYVARPVGAVILGHFGDRIGRQRVLMFTLVLMGLSTFLIGCLPTFSTIGWAAPVLLVLCRLMQGFSAAGEQAGASSLTLEHSPDDQRAFYTSWTLTGTQGGLILASLILIPFMALPDDAKYSWGWRVPFWCSAVVVVVAYFIRRQLHETPQFQRALDQRPPERLPILTVLRDHPGNLLRARLAPDMFDLTRQIQIATDQAKGCGARLAGVEVPKFEDVETTIPELKARIARTQEFLRGLESRVVRDEQAVRRLVMGHEIAIGLVENESDAGLAAELQGRREIFRRIDRARRVVGVDEHHRARPRRQQVADQDGDAAVDEFHVHPVDEERVAAQAAQHPERRRQFVIQQTGCSAAKVKVNAVPARRVPARMLLQQTPGCINRPTAIGQE